MFDETFKVLLAVILDKWTNIDINSWNKSETGLFCSHDSGGSIFTRRSDYSSFNVLPRSKINSYHIKVRSIVPR